MPFPPVGVPLPGDPGLPDDLILERDEPTEADLLGLCPDLLAGPPDGEDAWLAARTGRPDLGSTPRPQLDRRTG